MSRIKCSICHWEYPESLLNEMITEGVVETDVCAICALATRNKVHGLSEGRFQGTIAESLRLLAIKWRKKHPNCKPQIN